MHTHVSVATQYPAPLQSDNAVHVGAVLCAQSIPVYPPLHVHLLGPVQVPPPVQLFKAVQA